MSRFQKRMPSVMPQGSRFSQIPRANIPRSRFDRSHGYKTAFNAGYLIPVFVDEALPGDTFHLKGTFLTRMATPIFPIMDNLHFDTFFFSVPYRLVWDNWEKFMGSQTDPGDSTDFLVPHVTSGGSGWPIGSLSDYFGLPTGIGGLEANSLHHRAYRLIWNEWFRDQNLQDSVTVPTGDGPDTGVNGLLKRGKRHDYFTSCLPWPQKGPSVPLPLGQTAPVESSLDDDQLISASGPFRVQNSTDTGPFGFERSGSTSDSQWRVPQAGNQPFEEHRYDSGLQFDLGAVTVDLSDATAATINQLRQSFQIQRMFERDARGGTRYTEMVLAHFGVSSPDARLQRPEYLGGGSTPINITPVAATATDEDIPQGNLAAVGMGVAHNQGFFKSFTEHCLIIGLVNVRADLTYQQGMDRMWSRQTRFDFYFPAFAHLGEQAVLNKEIFAQGGGSAPQNEEVFGYQERWAEYRHKPSRITNIMRSTAATSLDAWHLSQEFASLPQLNEEFIEEDPPIDRVVAVTDEPHFILDAYFDFKAARPMPTYSVPGLIDHF